MSIRRRLAGVVAATAVAASLAACGGSATATTAPATATTGAPAASVSTAPRASVAASAAPSAAASAPAATGASAAPAVKKVNANTATVAELQAAFQAAGIANAAKWAREVEEYRPYPTNDPTYAKLRAELAKYNPGPGVVDQIIACLSL